MSSDKYAEKYAERCAKYAEKYARIRKSNFKKAVDAVYRDDISTLKAIIFLLPEFNTMVDRNDRTLLFLSCMLRKKKVFDYLLNLNCFDLEAVDSCKQHTVLTEALSSSQDEYFGVELIEAGAKVHSPHLHLAIRQRFLKSAKLLLEKGVDPNAQDEKGRTALHILLCYHTYPKVDEIMDLLLQYGADTGIYDEYGYLPFDCAITHGSILSSISISVQEHLLYCTVDSHSDYIMPSTVFSKFLTDVSRSYSNILPHASHWYDNTLSLFNNVMDVVPEVFFEPNSFPFNLFTIPPDILKKIIERYSCVIAGIFSSMKPCGYGKMAMNIDNVAIFLNSELHFVTVELISKLELSRIYLDNFIIDQEEISSLILYLLSYGLNVTSYDCHVICQYQGYSELFKTMLLLLDHADTSRIDCPMTEIILDIHCDLNTVLARFDRRFPDKIAPLLHYFANPDLRLFCENLGNELHPNIINKVRQLPRVPSLLQLARDETRRHIVRRLS